MEHYIAISPSSSFLIPLPHPAAMCTLFQDHHHHLSIIRPAWQGLDLLQSTIHTIQEHFLNNDLNTTRLSYKHFQGKRKIDPHPCSAFLLKIINWGLKEGVACKSYPGKLIYLQKEKKYLAIIYFKSSCLNI